MMDRELYHPKLRLQTTNVTQQTKLKNLISLLTRITAADNSTISSWTGFSIQIRNEITMLQDSHAPTHYQCTCNWNVHSEWSFGANTLHHAVPTSWSDGVCLRSGSVCQDCRNGLETGEIPGHNYPDGDLLHNMQPAVYHKEEIPECMTPWPLRGGRHLAQGSVAGVMEGRKYNRRCPL